MILVLIIGVISISTSLAQSNEKKETIWKTDTINVDGKCGMCKENIEGALKKKDGIKAKDWSPKTHLLVVTYDVSVIKIDDIRKKVAAAGYDTDKVKAPNDAYNKLDNCCKYQRTN